MDLATQQLIQAIHDCPTRLVLAVAGAGTQALSNLLTVPGASRTLIEAIVPYSEASFDEFLGQTPPQYVSHEAARLLAGRAYTRACRLLPQNGAVPLVGVAVTATIATDRPKKGEHRAYIATWQSEKITSHYLHLGKGVRDRAGEEEVISRLLLNTLAAACKLEAALPLPLKPEDKLTTTTYDLAGKAHALLIGDLAYFGIADNGRLQTNLSSPALLLSGSFNPLHDGHIELLRTAATMMSKPAAFELSVVNADKPPLPLETLLHRLAQFAGRHTIYASTAPTFVEKARLYPGTTFVVGYDTAIRILQPHYYDDHHTMLQALAEIREQGCDFLVAGRVDDNGRFHQASTLTIPSGYQDIFHPISDHRFRKDISSTELRQD